MQNVSRFEDGGLFPREVFADSICLCSLNPSNLGDLWLLTVPSELPLASVRALKNESILADFFVEFYD